MFHPPVTVSGTMVCESITLFMAIHMDMHSYLARLPFYGEIFKIQARKGINRSQIFRCWHPFNKLTRCKEAQKIQPKVVQSRKFRDKSTVRNIKRVYNDKPFHAYNVSDTAKSWWWPDLAIREHSLRFIQPWDI